jgi:endonuclease/exonuclease/phosphatase (EEP) superfamily protein YafD
MLHLLVWGFNMLTLNEMRNKHWSGRNTLWPRTTVACQVRFDWQGLRINRKALMVAQDEARDAVVTGEQKYWNRANYFLTAAYMGDSRHDAFWGQF